MAKPVATKFTTIICPFSDNLDEMAAHIRTGRFEHRVESAADSLKAIERQNAFWMGNGRNMLLAVEYRETTDPKTNQTHYDILNFTDIKNTEETFTLPHAIKIPVKEVANPFSRRPDTPQDDRKLRKMQTDDVLANSPEIIKIRTSIKALQTYVDGHSNTARREAASNLVACLTGKLDNFLRDQQVITKKINKNEIIEHGLNQSFESFKQDFDAELYSDKYKCLNQDKAYEKVLLINIALAMTGVGALFVGAKMLHSYVTTNKVSLLFEKTKERTKVDEIGEDADKLTSIKPK